jgi:hypothetical protein
MQADPVSRVRLFYAQQPAACNSRTATGHAQNLRGMICNDRPSLETVGTDVTKSAQNKAAHTN